MPTTSNFGWTTPADTDLVKDGAAAIRTLGNNIDTSLVDLKGGTTGQVLSKNSNTDLDFTWVAQDDSNAIQNALLTTTGDTIYASAASTPARLEIGTTGQVLTVAGGVPSWATPAASIPANSAATAGIGTNQTTTSTSYTDLSTSGPAVTVTTGTKALVIVSSDIQNNTGGGTSFMSYAVSGATTISASDVTALAWRQDSTTTSKIVASKASVVTLTAGSNTFTAKYRVSSGTGTWVDREIFVINLA